MIRRIAACIAAVAMAVAPLSAADMQNGGAYRGGNGSGEMRYAAVQPGGPSALPNGSGPISRIKDIASLQATRENQLVGYGLVIGLQGSGDGLRNSPFTEQSIRAMLENLGIATEGGRSRSTNVAAVIVTANLPPFVRSGSRIDVTVSSLGDAASLAGGTLVMTPLRAADGEIYAVAQGPVIVSGFQAQGQAEQVTQGVPTAGRLPNGAIVEREVDGGFGELTAMILQLRNPDFSTAIRITDAINQFAEQRYGKRVAAEQDARTVVVQRPAGISTARFFAELENIQIRSDTPAKVVVDERTGTIVIGQDVKIARVAISHGALTVRITEMPRVVQPAPFSEGETAIEPFTAIEIERPDSKVAILDGPDLQTLVAGLNRLGVKPDGVIAILQGIKSAGALQAELVLQ